MRSRMDRYITNSDLTNSTRSSKNEKLYSSLENHAQYTTLTDVRNSNAIELTTDKKSYQTREGYHKIKEYGGLVEPPKVKKELDDFNFLYSDRKNKVYDINSVLEEAKRNRSPKDIEQEKRKLVNEQLILTKEQIEEYRNEKKNETRPDHDKMKDLINTITSKTLSGELDQKTSVDLLSELMATTKQDRVDEKEVTDVLNEKDLEKVLEEKDNYSVDDANAILKDMDQSFYTRSMDLSDKDFDIDEEFFEKKKVPSVIKIFIALLLVILLVVLVYFIIHSF